MPRRRTRGDLHTQATKVELGQRAPDRVRAGLEADGVEPRLIRLVEVRGLVRCAMMKPRSGRWRWSRTARIWLTTRRTGTPTMSIACEARIRLDSKVSGTTSAAPASSSCSSPLSSRVRTITGSAGLISCAWASTLSADGWSM
jgi:hypothetical protein